MALNYDLDDYFIFNSYTVFPHIVSALEWFPPLNSFRTCVCTVTKGNST